jgi:hypothetical protein
MREFTREMRSDLDAVRHTDLRFAIASVLAAALAAVAFIGGIAMVLGYEPIVQQAAIMGLPRAALPILGAVAMAGAVALLFPTTGFVAAAVLGGICTIAAIAYVRIGENGFALATAGLAALYFVDMVVRTPVVLVEGKRLWARTTQPIVHVPRAARVR